MVHGLSDPRFKEAVRDPVFRYLFPRELSWFLAVCDLPAGLV